MSFLVRAPCRDRAPCRVEGGSLCTTPGGGRFRPGHREEEIVPRILIGWSANTPREMRERNRQYLVEAIQGSITHGRRSSIVSVVKGKRKPLLLPVVAGSSTRLAMSDKTLGDLVSAYRDVALSHPRNQKGGIREEFDVPASSCTSVASFLLPSLSMCFTPPPRCLRMRWFGICILPFSLTHFPSPPGGDGALMFGA